MWSRAARGAGGSRARTRREKPCGELSRRSQLTVAVLDGRLDLAALVPFIPARDQHPVRVCGDGVFPERAVQTAVVALRDRAWLVPAQLAIVVARDDRDA